MILCDCGGQAYNQSVCVAMCDHLELLLHDGSNLRNGDLFPGLMKKNRWMAAAFIKAKRPRENKF